MNLTYPETSKKDTTTINQEIDELISNIRNSAETGLHVGCGYNIIPELINCDRYNNSADIHLDATDLKDFSDSSVDLIENHHIIEHLSFDETEKALAEWSRVLKTGGYLITTCPDLNKVADLWIDHQDDEDNTDFRDYILKMIFGSQEHDGMFHKSGFNIKILSYMLEKIGFEIEFAYSPYPDRTTPSMLIIARKKERIQQNSTRNIAKNTVHSVEYYKNKRISDYINSYSNFKSKITECITNRSIDGAFAIYGTGNLSEIIISSGSFSAVIDRDETKWNTTFRGLPIIPLNDIDKFKIKNIVIASIAHKDDIKNRIENQISDINIITLDL